MARRPVILVAPRWMPESMRGEERVAPLEAIADCFVDAILAAGGLPLTMAITTDEDVIDAYVDMADGVAVPGGPDVNPARWGSTIPYDPALLCEQRDAFEFPLVRRALERDVPLFTTCRGTQLLNVALGGTLCVDVPSLGAREGMAQWRHVGILNGPAHPIEVEEGSLLQRAL
ncbi:MAG TPA: gamma-glutamyl-gamma-aminobutyrate hydrolase family protein, partial [Candidatus Olsenella pullicola]|nr:gamma-glutamyl-gamma-aminobutyrate hydrolase family protein [Candidatus Olsenella pullicola]